MLTFSKNLFRSRLGSRLETNGYEISDKSNVNQLYSSLSLVVASVTQVEVEKSLSCPAHFLSPVVISPVAACGLCVYAALNTTESTAERVKNTLVVVIHQNQVDLFMSLITAYPDCPH